jgi:hypothetical protein
MSKTDCMHIASSFSGIFEVLISHPLDRVKTEMQIMTLNNSKSNSKSNTSHAKTSIISGINNIYQTKKLKGFYSGILPRLAGIIPMRLMYWSSMTVSSDYVTHNKSHLEINLNKYMPNSISNLTINLIPGLITGFVQSIIDNPIEVAKIKLMSGSSDIKINNLYQGFGYLLGRNILFAIPVAYSVKTYGKENPFLAGAIGGLLGSIISHPLDVIKTERQRYKSDNKPSNLKKITLGKLALENPSYLMTGLSMRCSLSFINMGVGFVVFNYLYRSLYWFTNDKYLD